ncbi:hypothetical protein Pcar_3350 [Syntrophotalea carbinolica DSM 2380]|uniref:Uncharacterized protein n=2 Tax=Syntrophotalea carbinolica TaxID=19 RepID=Q0C6H2_SYNC1|nr:hypothetical protein Pcar_3350 [Syntrophotalea carbinolica DSM 2380]
MVFCKFKSMTQKKQSFHYIAFVLVLLLFVASLSAVFSRSKTKPTEQIVPILTKIARDMNQYCPTMLSESLRSDKVESQGNNLILHYSLVESDLGEINSIDLISDIEKDMVPTICKMDVWRKVLLKGAVFKAYYYDKHGKNIGNIDISYEKCLHYEQCENIK